VGVLPFEGSGAKECVLAQRHRCPSDSREVRGVSEC